MENLNASKEMDKPKIKGIRGWLIIPAIAFIYGPIVGAVNFFMAVRMIQDFFPELISDLRLWLIISIDIFMIAATIFVAFLFFKKRHSTVNFFIWLLVASIIARLFQFFLNTSMFDGADYDTIKPFIYACAYGAIWIPYFQLSKRVKNTFVE